MQAFMQSLQMRWPVAATSGLSTAMIASAASASPSVLAVWNSEIFSSSGQPASVTPNALFLNTVRCGASADGFSRNPFAHESLPWVWHQMQ
jgi:hypothetical protein